MTPRSRVDRERCLGSERSRPEGRPETSGRRARAAASVGRSAVGRDRRRAIAATRSTRTSSARATAADRLERQLVEMCPRSIRDTVDRDTPAAAGEVDLPPPSLEPDRPNDRPEALVVHLAWILNEARTCRSSRSPPATRHNAHPQNARPVPGLRRTEAQAPDTVIRRSCAHRRCRRTTERPDPRRHRPQRSVRGRCARFGSGLARARAGHVWPRGTNRTLVRYATLCTTRGQPPPTGGRSRAQPPLERWTTPSERGQARPERG